MDHADRIDRLARALREEEIAAAVVSQPQDLVYLTGVAQPCNLLLVPGEQAILFARRFLDVVRAGATDAVRVAAGEGFDALERELARMGVRGGRLAFELDVLPAGLYRKITSRFAAFEVVDCSRRLLALRAVKDPEEIERLRAATALYDAVHEAMAAHLRPGVAEHELAGEVLRGLRRAGHAGLSMQRRWDAVIPPEGYLASGSNLWTMSGGPVAVTGVGMSSAVPFGASTRRLSQGDLVNIDLGLNLAGYHADMARTYAVGHAPEALYPLTERLRRCQDAVIVAIRPGARTGDVYEAGLEEARALEVDGMFQGYGGTHGPYVGHGLGLELDEPPVLGPNGRDRIQAGMVLAVEVKLMSPDFGAVNLEDDVVVTQDGCRLLSHTPRTAFIADGEGGLEPIPVSAGR